MTDRVLGAFEVDEAREIKRRVLSDNRSSVGQHIHSMKNDQGWHFCILKEALDPATDPLTGYTQAQAAVLIYDVSGGNLDMVEVAGTDNYITVTNRDENFSAEVGKLILVRWNIREWMPLVSGGGVELYHGIVLEQCDATCNTYVVQRVHRYLTAGCEDCTGTGTG